MKKREFILAVMALLAVVCASAQDDSSDYDYIYDYDYSSYDTYDDWSYDDYNYDSYDYGDTYQQPCGHTGKLEIYEITRYRGGMSIYDETYKLPGKIRISEGCIEIYCEQFMLYFCIGERIKVDDTYYKFRRCNYDEHYDYIELRSMPMGNTKNFTMFVGRLDDDGNMHDTVMLNCRKLKVEYPKPKTQTKTK